MKFNFIKKETLAQVFFCEFCEISKNDFLTEHLRGLLLWYDVARLSQIVISKFEFNIKITPNIIFTLN